MGLKVFFGALESLPQVFQNSGLGDVDDEEKQRSACIRRTSWGGVGASEVLSAEWMQRLVNSTLVNIVRNANSLR